MTAEHWPAPDASWIGSEAHAAATNLFLEFVRRFTTAGDSDLTLTITAASRYVLYVNGQEVARGPAQSTARLRYFHRYTVAADKLTGGDNLLAVRLFHDGAETTTIQEFAYGPAGLLVAAQTADVRFVSDASWQVRRSPLFGGNSMVSQWGGYKEFYHGEHEDRWHTAAYDHSAWANADVLAPALAAPYAEALRLLTLPALAHEPLQPASIVDIHHNLGQVTAAVGHLPAPYSGQPMTLAATAHGAAPAIIFDFAQEVVGFPKLQIDGGFCIVELWYGESLDLYRYDVVRMPPSGVWTAFHRRAFRYLMLKFIALPQPVTLTSIAIDDVRYAYNQTGDLTTTDATLNQIVDISKQTLRANTSYHYEDCPWREQALWVFDMRVMALQNYYFYGDAALVAKNIRQIFALQQPDGSIPSTGPLDNNCYNLDFCLHLVATLREYYGYSGDQTLVAELGPQLDRLDAYLRAQVTDDGLMTTAHLTRGGAFLDWSRDIARGPQTVILNALYACYLDDMAFLDERRGRSASARRAQRQALIDTATRIFFDPLSDRFADTVDAEGRPVGASLQGNMAALYGGFLSGSAAQALLDRLKALPAPYAPAFYFIIFEALAALGRGDLIERDIRAYWGGMLQRGAVTWWEVFDPATPEWVYPHPFLGNTPTFEMDWIPTSACHGWSGTAGLAIPRHLIGVDLLQLWQNEIHIKPAKDVQLPDLTYRVPVRDGHLAVTIHHVDGQRTVTVDEAPTGVDIIIEV